MANLITDSQNCDFRITPHISSNGAVIFLAYVENISTGAFLGNFHLGPPFLKNFHFRLAPPISIAEVVIIGIGGKNSNWHRPGIKPHGSTSLSWLLPGRIFFCVFKTDLEEQRTGEKPKERTSFTRGWDFLPF